MFQIPAWEEDLPNSNIGFDQRAEKKLKSKTDATTSSNLKVKNNIPTPDVVAKKRKQNNNVIPTKKKKELVKDIDTDELLINAKKKKFNEIIENDDKEIQLLFKESNTRHDKRKKKLINSNSKIMVVTKQKGANDNSNDVKDRKKEILKVMLAKKSNRTHINTSGTSNKLRQRMLERLKAAQFRYLNEKLYTSSGSEAQQLFQTDPQAFQTYHQGYQQQVKKWPVNPLNVIVKKIMKMPKTHTIADLGCGEAALSKRVPHKVRSFDLVATSPGVEACDMAHTPLLAASVDVAVYCLALMGTELTKYLIEANRILKMGGHLLIAEVESRFDNVENFAREVERLGFKLKQLDKSNTVFFFLQFLKIREPPAKKSKLPALTLKPCLYKKR